MRTKYILNRIKSAGYSIRPLGKNFLAVKFEKNGKKIELRDSANGIFKKIFGYD